MIESINPIQEKDQDLYVKVQELLYAIYTENQSFSSISELSMYASILQILTLISKNLSSNMVLKDEITMECQMRTSNFRSICEYIFQ